MFKVVIITDLGQRQKSAQNTENTTDLPETLHVPSLCCFSSLEPQNAGLVDVKRSKGIFVRENLKNKHRSVILLGQNAVRTFCPDSTLPVRTF